MVEELSPETEICSVTFYPHFHLFKSNVLKLTVYICVKHGFLYSTSKVRGKASSEITGLYKYFRTNVSLVSLLKIHEPENNTAPSPHILCLTYMTVTYTSSTLRKSAGLP